MSTNDIGAIFAVVCLGNVFAFSQTSRHVTAGPFSSMVSALLIPITVAATWRLALSFGWWSIAVFVAAGLVAGAINGIGIRTLRFAGLVAMQPALGLAAITCLSVAWCL